LLPGSWCRKRGGEKKYTPALTLPAVRRCAGWLLEKVYAFRTSEQFRRFQDRIIRRNAQARAHHYKARNRLSPPKIQQRE